MLWYQGFWWLCLPANIPGPQLLGHLLWLRCDASDHGCCNQADRRRDEKRKGQNTAFLLLQLTRLFIFLLTLNRDETISDFWKTALLGWKRDKILLNFKWNCVFMEADSLWISTNFKVLKWHSLIFQTTCISEEVALKRLFSRSLKTDWCFWERLHWENATYCCLLHSARLFPASQTMRRHETVPPGRTDWLFSLFISFSSFVLKSLVGAIKVSENLSSPVSAQILLRALEY